ncbi:class I SAM-dependent methyltransferase [soil metagenome]
MTQFQEHDIEWTDEKVARMWDYYQRALTSGMYFGAQSGQHATYLINKHIGFSRLRNIIDLSCGRGDIIQACLPYLKDSQLIFGSDFSKASVEAVNTRFQEAKRFGGAFPAKSYPLYFEDGEFDLVISTEVVEHLTDNEFDSMIAEACRLLRPGGFIFITTPNDEDLIANTAICPDCGCKFHHWQHMRSWNVRSLEERMELHGFKSLHVQPVAWAENTPKRILFTLAARLKLKVETGLVYVGRLHQEG